MSAALGLLRLQQLDSRINQIDARLQEIREILENNTELIEARHQLSIVQTEVEDAEHARKTAEADAQAQRLKIQQVESNLYGGLVHNPKELQELQTDIGYRKKHLAAIEDSELESMANLEVAQVKVQQASTNMEQISIHLKDVQKILIEKQSQLTSDRASLETQRQAALKAVAHDSLETYENLRRLRRGVAVAEVLENACAACGTTLTAAIQQNARHAANLVHCPSCGRILFAG
jgi:predicted  nucleic acid-binding Zn-ribbon protein